MSGKGCRSRASVRIYLSGRRIESFDANSQGRFSELVEIPGSTDDGDHWVKAGCSGDNLGKTETMVENMADGEGKIAAQKEIAAAQDALLSGKAGVCAAHLSKAMQAGTVK